MQKENYLLIKTGWDNTGILIPISAAHVLKNALFMKSVTKETEEGSVQVDTVQHFKPQYEGRVHLISWEVVAAAIAAGEINGDE